MLVNDMQIVMPPTFDDFEEGERVYIKSFSLSFPKSEVWQTGRIKKKFTNHALVEFKGLRESFRYSDIRKKR